MDSGNMRARSARMVRGGPRKVQSMKIRFPTRLRKMAFGAAFAVAVGGVADEIPTNTPQSGAIRFLADTYLQSDGTQAINLEYHANPQSRIVAVFEPVSTNGSQYVFGSAFSSASDFQEGVYMQNGEVNFVCGDLWSGSGNAWGLGSGIKATRSRFTADLDIANSLATLKSGDSIVWRKVITSTRTKTDNIPLHVFANPHPYEQGGQIVNNPRDFSSVKLYSLSVYDGGALVRDLVPYGHGAVTGLLDRCSGKVYVNSRAEANPFVLGTDDGYVRSDLARYSGQWLDTGYNCGPDTKIEVDFAMLATNAQQRVFGAFGGGDEVQDGLLTDLYVNGGGNFAWAWQNDKGTGNWTSTGVKADSERHVFTIDSPNGTVSLTDAKGSVLYSAALSTTRSKTGWKTLRLFGCVSTNAAGTVTYIRPGSVRIYGLKIWDGDSLVRNYTPRIVNGEAGLYDEVNSNFYGAELAKPSSALQAGGAIACSSAADGDAHIESFGAQLIDTGYKNKRSSRIEASFLLEQRTGTQYVFAGINKTDNTWAVAENLGLYFQRTSFNKFATPIRYWNGSTTKTASPGNLDPYPGRISVTVDLKNGKGHWTIQGTQTTKDLSLPTSTDNPASILAFGRNGNRDLARIRLYSLGIYEDDAPKHIYYPALQDGMAGLWDAEEKKFLGNTLTSDGSGFALHGAGANGSGMAFTEHPQGGNVSRDGSLTLSAFAPGAVGYLWLKNGEIIEGETGRTLNVSYGRGGQTDTYQCLAHYNLFGYGLSDIAEVTSNPSAFIMVMR